MAPLIPFLESLGGFGFILSIFVLTACLAALVEYFDYRKRSQLIEAGLYEPRDDRAWILAGGLLLTAVGVGTFVESVLAQGAAGDGITIGLVGLAAVVYYYLKGRQDREHERPANSGPTTD